MNDKIKKDLKKYINSIGIELVGITNCRVFNELKEYYTYRKNNGFYVEFEEENIEKKINPFSLMENGKSIISIAIPYCYKESEGSKYFSKYTQGKDYHEVVKSYLQLICDYLKNMGIDSKGFVDNNPLPERYIAYLSGLGFVGKNNTFITEKYGSYVFLGEVIINLKLEPDTPISKDCGRCELCLKACPTKTLEKNKIDNNFNKCLSYITQKKHLSKDELRYIEGKIFGCDICQNVCPYNKEIQYSNIDEFKPFDFFKNDSLLDIINLNNNDFKNKYKNCSCGWRGKNTLIRNAMVTYKSIKNKDIDDIYKTINSPYIKDYYDKIFKNEKGEK
ncbi:tRNA epoxyqueuosine(34) reductase QueG [Clostridium senegalense]|uniref:tRNA epoxyqueuosine(34) reductase QueG n=1 Tax=Clostridium senegalense TaxID=1465809 RepID=UPI001C106E7F|nr:tRNA epoxyqueuosine(34) reductase QueG [Clostridium senegalense]MBU5227394.1 tRNA epoxyqueuosine(34) reductase QueG [Clostridium senegalense]